MEDSNYASMSPTDYVELICLLIFFAIGAPLNLAAYQSLAQRKPASKSSCSARIHRLKRHLNISDLMVLLLFCPVRVCWLLTYSWRGGDFLCRLLHFTNGLAFQSGSNIIVCIALDRLLSVSFPKTGSSGTKRVQVMLGTAWVLAILFTVPNFFINSTYSPWEGWDQCVNIWAEKKHQILVNMAQMISEMKAADNFTVNNTIPPEVAEQMMRMLEYTETRSTPELVYLGFSLVTLFWLPLLLIVISYIFVAVWLFRVTWMHMPSAPVVTKLVGYDRGTANQSIEVRRLGNIADETTLTYGSANSPRVIANSPRVDDLAMTHSSSVQTINARSRMSVIQVSNVRRVKRNAIRISALLVGAYVLCWTPLNIMALYQFYDYTTYQKHMHIMYCLNMLIVLNSVINPLLYGMFGTVKRFTRSG